MQAAHVWPIIIRYAFTAGSRRRDRPTVLSLCLLSSTHHVRWLQQFNFCASVTTDVSSLLLLERNFVLFNTFALRYVIHCGFTSVNFSETDWYQYNGENGRPQVLSHRIIDWRYADVDLTVIRVLMLDKAMTAAYTVIHPPTWPTWSRRLLLQLVEPVWDLPHLAQFQCQELRRCSETGHLQRPVLARGINTTCPSVCPSVCPSRAGIV